MLSSRWIADHLDAHDGMTRLEFFRLMAAEAVGLAGRKLRKSDVTETYDVSRAAVREWRNDLAGKRGDWRIANFGDGE